MYYRFKKYFYLECLSLFGCCDPEEEQRKKEEAERQLEAKKAEAEAEAKAAKKRQLPPGKFKLSEALLTIGHKMMFLISRIPI